MLRQRVPRRDERGFTLIEVLISVVILGIIIVPLGNALFGFFRNTADTTGRLSESHDLQIAAAYFAQDVQSVGRRNWTSVDFPFNQSVEVGVAAGSGLYPCSTGSTPAAAVRLAWDDPTDASNDPPTVIVSYFVLTVGTESQLHRLKCTRPPSGGPSTVESDVVLAHNISNVTATCVTACGGGTGLPAVPQLITLTLTIKNAATTDAGIKNVDLVGQRRQT
jgi:prepilin-type N-terminal cleavage/methylation domain-containing protein